MVPGNALLARTLAFTAPFTSMLPVASAASWVNGSAASISCRSTSRALRVKAWMGAFANGATLASNTALPPCVAPSAAIAMAASEPPALSASV